VNRNQLTGTIPDYTTIDSLMYVALHGMNIQGPTPAELLAWGGMAWVTTTPALDPALDGAGRQSTMVDISGTGAEPGGTVEVFVDDLSTVTGIVPDALGTWSTSIDLSAFTEGTPHVLTAVTTYDSWPGFPVGQRSLVTSSPVTVTIDDTAPVITLTGSAAESVEAGTAYTDPGATVSDNFDAAVAAVVTGSVDTNIPGTYILTYNATDSAGNAATSAERTVTVTEVSGGGGSGNGGGGGSFGLGMLLLMLPGLLYRSRGRRLR
jgi:hypothetical protein